MKKIIILVLLICLFGLSGCSSKLKNLNGDDIFKQKDTYFVYFYRDNCPNCELSKPYVMDYLKAIQESKYKNKRRLYGCNLSNSKNKSAYRVYSGSGQGLDSDNWIDGCTSFNELYVSGTPTLVIMGYNAETGKKVAKYATEGHEGVSNYLETYLNK